MVLLMQAISVSARAVITGIFTKEEAEKLARGIKSQ
jgi:hypothetical protein